MSCLYLDLIGFGSWLHILDNGLIVQWDVFSRGTFCLLRRFVPGTFLLWDVLSFGSLCLGTFCLRTLYVQYSLMTVFFGVCT